MASWIGRCTNAYTYQAPSLLYEVSAVTVKESPLTQVIQFLTAQIYFSILNIKLLLKKILKTKFGSKGE